MLKSSPSRRGGNGLRLRYFFFFILLVGAVLWPVISRRSIVLLHHEISWGTIALV
jgi:hypothetical protein